MVKAHRIMEQVLRNVFDQYSQLENRVTHALLSALNHDRKMLSRFLRDFLGIDLPTDPRRLEVTEQSYPGETDTGEEIGSERGIPDGWIYSETQKWCLVIESKVQARLSADQLKRHRRTASKLGYENIFILA